MSEPLPPTTDPFTPDGGEAPGGDVAPPANGIRPEDAPVVPTAGDAGGAIDHELDVSSASGRRISIDHALGVVRLGVGAALVVAPGWAGRIWVGPGADGPGSMVFARALGARDMVLGARILQGLAKGEPVRHWIVAGFAADAADFTAAVIAARHLTPARRVAMPLIAAAVGAVGVRSSRASAVR
jgi:hypothetical protein